VSNKDIQRKKELLNHGLVMVAGVILLLTVYFFIPNEYLFLEHEIPVSSLAILFALEIMYFIIYLFNTKRISPGDIRKFNLLLLIGLIVRGILLIITVQYDFILPLALTLYFLTNLPPLIFLWQVSDDHFDPIHSETTVSNKIQVISNRFGITKREQEIIEQISLGKTNQQIADELFISLQTVKDHTHRIYKKTGVNSRLKLITLLSE